MNQNRREWLGNAGFILALLGLMHLFFGHLPGGLLLWLGFGLSMGVVLTIRDLFIGYWKP